MSERKCVDVLGTEECDCKDADRIACWFLIAFKDNSYKSRTREREKYTCSQLKEQFKQIDEDVSSLFRSRERQGA